MMVFTVPAVKLAYFLSCMRLLFQQSPSSEEGIAKKPLYDNGTSCRLQISAIGIASRPASITASLLSDSIAPARMTVPAIHEQKGTHLKHRGSIHRKFYLGYDRCFLVFLYNLTTPSSRTILLRNRTSFLLSSAPVKGLLTGVMNRLNRITGGAGWITRMKEKLRQGKYRRYYANKAWRYPCNKRRRCSIFYGILPTL